MADMLTAGANFLSARLKDRVSVPVVYRRLGAEVSIQASIPPVMHEAFNEEGFLTAVEQYGFVVTAADLVLFGGVIEPQAGDEIEDSHGRLFRVIYPGPNAAPWRQLDGSGVLIQIFAKRAA